VRKPAFIILLLLITFASGCIGQGGQEERQAGNYTPAPQAMGPSSIAITEDGKHAYVGFQLSDDVFKVSLEDMTIEAVADLSDHFPLQCYNIALDASERKLFVHSASRNELLVLDAWNMSLIHTIKNISTAGMSQSMLRSRYGPFLIIWDNGNTVKLVNTETYEVTSLTDQRIGFIQIEESRSDPDKWYVATQQGPEWVIGAYDYKTK